MEQNDNIKHVLIRKVVADNSVNYVELFDAEKHSLQEITNLMVDYNEKHTEDKYEVVEVGSDAYGIIQFLLGKNTSKKQHTIDELIDMRDDLNFSIDAIRDGIDDLESSFDYIKREIGKLK